MTERSTLRKGQCVNYGDCSKAGSQEIIEIYEGEDFKCPECGKHLVAAKKKKFPWLIVIIVALLLIAGAIAALIATDVIDADVFKFKKSPEPVTVTEKVIESESETEVPADEPVLDAEGELLPEGEEVTAGETIVGEEIPEGGLPPVFIQTIKLDKEAVTLKENQKLQLEWTFIPEDAVTDKLEWKSSNREVAVVKDGLVTALNPGKATIQLKDTEGNLAMAICEVTVVENPTNTLNFGYGKYTGEIKNGKANGFGKLVFSRSHQLSEYDKTQKRMAEPGDYVEGQFENNNFYSGKWFDKYGNQKGAIILQKLGL